MTLTISNAENRVLDWLEHYKIIVVIGAVSIIGLLLRISLYSVVSIDAEAFLLPWFETIASSGGFPSLGQQVGDYGIPY